MHGWRHNYKPRKTLVLLLLREEALPLEAQVPNITTKRLRHHRRSLVDIPRILHRRMTSSSGQVAARAS